MLCVRTYKTRPNTYTRGVKMKIPNIKAYLQEHTDSIDVFFLSAIGGTVVLFLLGTWIATAVGVRL